MFIPHLFHETRLVKLHEVMTRYPLGTVVLQTAAGLDANPLPFELDPTAGPYGTLRAHFSREHPFGHAPARDRDCLIVFQSPSAYISPSWQPSVHKHGKVQPNWFYAVVHAYGTLRVIDEPPWLAAHVRELTAQREGDEPGGWSQDQAPADFIARLMRQIVGVEIRIERLLGKWQLGQQKRPEDLDGIVAGLAATAVPSNQALVELILEARAEREARRAG